MSDIRKLVDIYESFSTKKNISILSEAVEHAISKTPMFLSDSDIDFLEQFDEKYFAQALKKRYDLFGHYLANLYQLRKIVYDKSLPKAEEDNSKYWSNKKFANLPPFVRRNQAHMQSQSQAKAIASDMFPAGQKIPENIIEKSPYFKDLDENEKKRLSRVVRNINRYYLSDEMGTWGGFIDRNKPPQSFGAKSFLSKMASEIEGKLGEREGFDLNNPRIFVPKKEGDLDENLYERLKELVQKSKTETDPRESSKLRRELAKFDLDADSTYPEIKRAAQKNIGAVEEDIESRARIITDGFKIPSLQQIRDQLRKHMVSMGKGLAKHSDATDLRRLASSIENREHKQLSDDKGVDSITKQLEKAYERRVRAEEAAAQKAAEAAKKPFVPMKPNERLERARQLMKADLKNITNDNFKKYLLQSKTGQKIDKPLDKLTAMDLKQLGISKKELNDIMSIEDPFKGLGFETDVTGKLVKNKDASAKITLPYKKTTVQRWIGKNEAGEDMYKPEEVTIPALSKSNFYNDSYLANAHDNPDAADDLDNLLTNIGPLSDESGKVLERESSHIGRGPKIFDPELFQRILRRVKALRDPATPPQLAQKFIRSLGHFNLNANSTMQEIVEASKRYFKKAANRSAYKQGSDVSATFSHHPGRLSARANFLNRYRKTGEFDDRMGYLIDNGVVVDEDPPLFTPFMVFVSDTVSTWLATTDAKSEIPKAIMNKAKDALINLCTLRIIENLDDSGMFREVKVPIKDAPPDAPEDKKFKIITAGNAPHIRYIINLELKRYYDQNLMTGPLRRKGNFLEILEEDAEKELTCKQGKKRSAPGTCVQGMDLRTLQDLYSTGIENMEEGVSDDDDEEGDVSSVRGSIVAERKKIAQVVEGYYDVIKSMYGMYKIFAKLKGKLNNEQAKAQALIDITEFFRNTISLDDQGFLHSVHTTYAATWNALKALAKTDPAVAKKLEGIEVAEDFKSPTKEIVDANTFAKRLSDKKARLMSGDVSPFNLTLTDENIGAVTDAFLELAQEEPHKAPMVFQKITEKLNKQGAPLMLQMFLRRAQPVNDDVLQRQREAGKRENIIRDIAHPMFFDGESNPANFPNKLGDRTQREAEAKRMLKNVNKYVKIISDRALTGLLSYINTHKNYPHNMKNPVEAAAAKSIAENKSIIKQAIKILEDEALARGKYLQSIAHMDNPMNLLRGS